MSSTMDNTKMPLMHSRRDVYEALQGLGVKHQDLPWIRMTKDFVSMADWKTLPESHPSKVCTWEELCIEIHRQQQEEAERAKEEEEELLAQAEHAATMDVAILRIANAMEAMQKLAEEQTRLLRDQYLYNRAVLEATNPDKIKAIHKQFQRLKDTEGSKK